MKAIAIELLIKIRFQLSEISTYLPVVFISLHVSLVSKLCYIYEVATFSRISPKSFIKHQ